jgi:hypothetical protein
MVAALEGGLHYRRCAPENDHGGDRSARLCARSPLQDSLGFVHFYESTIFGFEFKIEAQKPDFLTADFRRENAIGTNEDRGTLILYRR